MLGHRGSVLTAILHEINAVLVSFQTPSKCFTQRTQGNKELMYPLDIRILFFCSEVCRLKHFQLFYVVVEQLRIVL